MSDERIDPKVIEVAVRAEMDAENAQFGWGKLYSSLSAEDRAARHETMEAAIRAADRERGLKEERMSPDPDSMTQFAPQVRLISDWRPVERGGKNG